MSQRPEVRLHDVMRLDLTPCRVEADQTYPNIGIYSFGRGTFAKPPIEAASTSAQTLYRVSAGQVIYSRLFAFEGAYSTVPAEHDGAYVSNEFPTFTVSEERAVPAFIGWLFRWEGTWAALRKRTVGMGDRRQRIHPDSVLAHAVRLPSRSEQLSIVARLDDIADTLAARRAKANIVASEVEATLRSAFARIIADAPRVAMGDIAPLVRRPVVIDPDASYPELGVRSFGKGLFTKPDLIGAELTWQSLYRIDAGDIVFSNIKAWEGAFTVAEREHHGKHGSHRYLTCVPDADGASAHFLCYYLQSDEGIYQVGNASVGSADRNRTLATKRLQAIKVPVPSLDTQLWFDNLQAKARAAKVAQAEAAVHLDQLLPAMLHEVFG